MPSLTITTRRTTSGPRYVVRYRSAAVRIRSSTRAASGRSGRLGHGGIWSRASWPRAGTRPRRSCSSRWGLC
jgi:hypothetical protein